MALKKAAKKIVVVSPSHAATVVNKNQISELATAHGLARVLAVGVSTQMKASGFQSLKVCANDASSVRDRFADIQQLNADPDFCVKCVSGGTLPATRGHILGQLHELANGADSESRLIFFYSGHGVRLHYKGTDEFFLVPEDAFSGTDADALIPFSVVTEILNKSAAKQKLIVLDACFSGPDVSGLKALPAELSPKFMKEYLAKTKGAGVLSSSGIGQESTAQSPNPKLSLFTHYFCEALSGEEKALDNGRLTLNSLYDYLSVVVLKMSKSYNRPQLPALKGAFNGTIILADFTVSLLVSSAIDLEDHPISSASFSDEEPGKVIEVLTNIKQWTYSQEYLEGKVNANLHEAFEDRFGGYAAKLTEEAGIPFGEISVEHRGVQFPDGGYSVRYEAEDKKSGRFCHVVTFGETWLGQPKRMIDVLDCFDLRPTEIRLDLSGKRSLDSMIAGLKARGWKLVSNKLPKEFTASSGRYGVVVRQDYIEFSGFYPEEILGSESEPEKAALVSGILGLLSD
jgi:Caspase domain